MVAVLWRRRVIVVVRVVRRWVRRVVRVCVSDILLFW